MRKTLLAILALSACIGQTEPSPDDSEAPLASYDGLLGGAPENSALPNDNKADAVYPAVHAGLIPTMTEVKSQGSRGVCSIFATVALMEHLYKKSGADTAPDFSEQFLQWSVKNEVGAWRNTGGSNASENLEAISDFGIVAEALWPYESSPWTTSNNAACTGPEENQPVVCFTNGDPPQTALDGPRFKLPRGRWVNTNSIKAHITDKGSAVIVGMDFFYQSWNHRRSTIPVNAEYWRQGYVLAPNAKDVEESHKQRAGHAIVIVGWDDNLEVPIVDGEGKPILDGEGKPRTEKGFWIFKNSWGTSGFGIANPNGAGYGYLSMAYVEDYGSAYASDFPVAAPPQPVDGEHYTAAPNTAIPDNDSAGVTSAINVPTAGAATAVSVSVNIEHTYVGDLAVSLEHAGQTYSLYAQEGGSDDNLVKTFIVAGAVGVEKGGVWTLRAADTAAQDTGTLKSWSLDLK